MKINETDLERLMSFVSQRGCWFWDGTRNSKYHPIFEIDGVTYSPEHLLYQNLCGVQVQRIKSKCRVTGCINPAHKVGGARADVAKLDGEKVQRIRASDKPSVNLAKEYGVSTQTICDIWRGKTWTNVPGRRETARSRRNKVAKPKRIWVQPGIKFDPDTGKYIASYYKKTIGESDSLVGAVLMRNMGIP